MIKNYKVRKKVVTHNIFINILIKTEIQHTYLAPNGLTPVELTSGKLHLGKDASHGTPGTTFKITNNLGNLRSFGQSLLQLKIKGE